MRETVDLDAVAREVQRDVGARLLAVAAPDLAGSNATTSTWSRA